MYIRPASVKPKAVGSVSTQTRSVHVAQDLQEHIEEQDQLLSEKDDAAAEECVNKRILLIEDDRSTRMFAKTFLSKYGDVVTAPNLSHGVTKYMVIEPDIIFIDVNLPDGDGYQILDFIMYSHPDAYVVMYSGTDGEDSVQRAIKAGAKGFVPKEFFTRDALHHLKDAGVVDTTELSD